MTPNDAIKTLSKQQLCSTFMKAGQR